VVQYLYFNIQYLLTYIDSLPACMCVGRRGLFTGSSGLTVAYLSGVESSGEAAADDAHFAAKDVDDLRQSLAGAGQFRGVDLLLTSQWPRGVDKYATAVVSFCTFCPLLGYCMLLLCCVLTYSCKGLKAVSK